MTVRVMSGMESGVTEDARRAQKDLTELCESLLRKIHFHDRAYATVERYLQDGDDTAALQEWRLANSYADEGLRIALEIGHYLPDDLMLRSERIRWVEDLLGWAEGEIDKQISRHDFRKWRLRQMAYLKDQRDRLPLDLPDREAFEREGSELLAAMLRVACATMIGAFLAAPLGAFLVNENVLKEVVKAGIAAFLGTVGVEIATPAINRLTHGRTTRSVSTSQYDIPFRGARPHPTTGLAGPRTTRRSIDPEGKVIRDGTGSPPARQRTTSFTKADDVRPAADPSPTKRGTIDGPVLGL